MNIRCTFKKMSPSDELSEHAQSRLDRLVKFEMKPIESAHVIFKPQARGEFEVEVILSGADSSTWQASARGDNFIHAVDLAVERVSKQMVKKKGKVQHHKSHELSREGQLEHMSEALEPQKRRKRA